MAERADCALLLPPGMASPRRLALNLGAMLTAPGAERHVLVTLGAAGPLSPLVLREEAMRWHMLDLPLLPAGQATVPVTIHAGPPVSPAAVGRGDDARPLGVSLSTILLLP